MTGFINGMKYSIWLEKVSRPNKKKISEFPITGLEILTYIFLITNFFSGKIQFYVF